MDGSVAPEQFLKEARQHLSQAEIAGILGKTERTVRRWENGEIPTPQLVIPALREA